MSEEGNAAPSRKGSTLGGTPVNDELPQGWGTPAPSRVGRVGQWGVNSASSSGRNSPSGSRFGTLASLSRGGSPKPAQERQEGNELYTGGERSGLAVQNPDRPGGGPPSDSRSMVNDILQQAANSGPPTDSSSPASRDPWSSAGHTLGSDEVESVQVGTPPSAPGGILRPHSDEVQRRTLTFWRDGFSIEDGELYKYDAPGNRELLAAIHAGRAPVSLFNVGFDQPLELVVQQRTTEAYVAPPKIQRPFSGGGNRLGSVVPTASGANSPARSTSTREPSPAPVTPGSAPPHIKVDDTKPVTNVQIRLADGTRKVVKINLSQTVADLRAYVTALSPGDTRSFILQTTFPPRELPDEDTIEGAKLANAVVVQRYR